MAVSEILDGVRVLDFGRYIAGPYCACLLGDLGADVIRVERVGGSEDRWVTPVGEDGKVTAPVKGATLIGDGPTVLTRVKGIGNDFALDEGIGVCGKGGQSVPAGVGQPTLLIDGLTVGGTAA